MTTLAGASSRKKWKTRVELANAIFEYIEIFHNRQRRHSALGYRTPIEYETLEINDTPPQVSDTDWHQIRGTGQDANQTRGRPCYGGGDQRNVVHRKRLVRSAGAPEHRSTGATSELLGRRPTVLVLQRRSPCAHRVRSTGEPTGQASRKTGMRLPPQRTRRVQPSHRTQQPQQLERRCQRRRQYF